VVNGTRYETQDTIIGNRMHNDQHVLLVWAAEATSYIPSTGNQVLLV
jgi:hypothetical protein